MYGIVNDAVRGLVKSAFGDAAWHDIHTQAGAPEAFVAMPGPISDDSGCVNVTANTCGFYPSAFCSGEESQTAPMCSNACTDDGECDANAHCDDVCIQDLVAGLACDENISPSDDHS